MDLVWQIIISVLTALLVSVLIILKYLHARYVETTYARCTSSTDLSGKVAVVSGANTGIGYFTALDFARRKARVILACRDLKKGQEAVDKIKSSTGNNDVVVMKLDLSSFQSVRNFATMINKQENRLDILVNNAGALILGQLDMMMRVNYFGHFLLTNLLLGLLKKSAPSRIVNVTSAAHRESRGIDFENLKAEKSFIKTLTALKAYQNAKLGNVLFTRELARRLEGSGVTSYSVHPGAVDTKIWGEISGLFSIVRWFFQTPEEGAQTTIYCSVSEDLEGVSGKFYYDCNEAEDKSSSVSKDMDLAQKLWEISETYTGLKEQ
ncbi:retinol dehydrogenase 11-like isoform X2 [Mercenaria mercenaria]|nr:retinol dehydrogenase 11-like isoform X2 [Mercenaria mercenaria]